MKFEFSVSPSFNFVSAFSERFKIPVYKNSVAFPKNMGKGSIKMIEVEPGFKLVIHRYRLKESFHLKRLPTEKPNDWVSIIFNSHEIPTAIGKEKQEAIRFLKNHDSAIQISSSTLGTETFFPKDAEVYFVVMGIRKSVLTRLLSIEKKNTLVEKILKEDSTFFFHENMSVDVKKTLERFSIIHELDPLGKLYYKIKTSELLYLLFSKLLAREGTRIITVNKSDIDKLYQVRTAVITNLSIPPKLSELALMAGMSETKLKQLFKQVFGNTIYNYYQKERMTKAAFLIKQAGYTVSEVGYQLGFTNLSHFSRLFARHHGQTPKKYSTG